jgi:protein-tyrosine phosphatase
VAAVAPFPVLFVCVGNVCRSPYAEILLRSRLADHGAADRFGVGSAGVLAEVGRPMHRRMSLRLVEAGASPEGFVARQFEERMVPPTGLVLALTKDIRARVLVEVPAALRRTFTLLEFATLAADAPSGLTPRELVRDCGDRRSAAALTEYDVADPIHEPDEVVLQVSQVLDAAVDTVAASLAATVDEAV